MHDPTCVDAQVLGFRAVLWDPKNGSKGKIKARELRPFGHDSASAATAINDAGQAVGISGDCDQAVGRFSARHAVLWEQNGKPVEIPNLGGKTWHTPMDINAQGDVVGFSNPPGAGDPEGEFISRAFRWVYGAAKADDSGRSPAISSAKRSPSTRMARWWAYPSAVPAARAPSLAERRARRTSTIWSTSRPTCWCPPRTSTMPARSRAGCGTV